MFLRLAARTAAFAPQHNLVFLPVIGIGLILFCALIASPGAAQTMQSDDQPRKVSGTVINSVTKAPIARALVSTSDNRVAMLTDSEGHFEFTLRKESSGIGGSGMFISRAHQHRGCSSWVQARKPGYLDCIDFGAGSADDDLTIALVPEALIYGRVTLSSSEALSGTDVQLFYREIMDGLPRWVPRHNARTNSAGEFRFAELPAGEYKLLTRERADDDLVPDASGRMFAYPPVFYPGAADFDSAQTIQVSAGQSVEADLVAARQPYYRVNIPISNNDISSGLNVTVRAQAGPGYSLGYSRGTNRIEGSLPNGNYVVQAAAYGPNVVSGMVSLKVDSTNADGPVMTLTPAGSIVLDVRENFTGTWSGSSSWNDGKRTFTMRGPRAYLNVQLQSADESEPMGGASLRPPAGPGDESMVVENVLPGRYWLRLSTARGYVASARMGDVDLLRQPLVVPAGPLPPIQVELRDDTAEINGTVTGLEPHSSDSLSQVGGPRAWVYCIPTPDSPGQFNQAIVTQESQFQHSAIAPGSYRILAFASEQRHLPYRDAEAMKAYDSKGPVIQVAAGQKVTVQVPLINDSDAPEQ